MSSLEVLLQKENYRPVPPVNMMQKSSTKYSEFNSTLKDCTRQSHGTHSRDARMVQHLQVTTHDT